MSWKSVAWSLLVLSVGLIGCDPPQNITPPPGSTGSAKTEPELAGNAGPGSAVPVAPAMAKQDAASRPVPDGFTQTDSGLRYKIMQEGAGKKPTPENNFTAKYRGWLDNGTEFDSGQIGPHPMRGVVPGWTEGLQLIGEGGKIELEIPPALGYGVNGQGPIPPDSWLHFEVELLKVQ